MPSSRTDFAQRTMEAHEVLGVPKDASEDIIRVAYKALALKWHPDRHINNREEATAKFVEINGANRTMLRNIRRARRAAAATPSSSVTVSSPSSPETTTTSLPDKSTQTSTSRPSSPHQKARHSPSPSSASSSHSFPSSSASDSASNSSFPSESRRGRPSSRSTSPASVPPKSPKTTFDTPARTSSSTPAPKPGRSRLRKQSRSTSCRPDPITGDYTPKSSPRRKASVSAVSKCPAGHVGPERVEETLHPIRSILRATGADTPKRWVHVLKMPLEELYHGKTFHFRVVRYRRSGKKSVVPLDLTVAPGTRPGTEIVVEDAGNERKDGSMQAIVFMVQETKHERFRRVQEDLLMEVRLPWVDSLDEKSGDVYFQGVDGKEYMFTVDYPENRMLSGTAVIPGAGMPSRNGTGRGRAVIRWEISSPASSWNAIKQVLKFKA